MTLRVGRFDQSRLDQADVSQGEPAGRVGMDETLGKQLRIYVKGRVAVQEVRIAALIMGGDLRLEPRPKPHDRVGDRPAERIKDRSLDGRTHFRKRKRRALVFRIASTPKISDIYAPSPSKSPVLQASRGLGLIEKASSSGVFPAATSIFRTFSGGVGGGG